MGEIAFVLHPTVYPELYELIMILNIEREERERGGERLKLLQEVIASYMIKSLHESKY